MPTGLPTAFLSSMLLKLLRDFSFWEPESGERGAGEEKKVEKKGCTVTAQSLGKKGGCTPLDRMNHKGPPVLKEEPTLAGFSEPSAWLSRLPPASSTLAAI